MTSPKFRKPNIVTSANIQLGSNKSISLEGSVNKGKITSQKRASSAKKTGSISRASFVKKKGP